jgi:hypothetical protein
MFRWAAILLLRSVGVPSSSYYMLSRVESIYHNSIGRSDVFDETYRHRDRSTSLRWRLASAFAMPSWFTTLRRSGRDAIDYNTTGGTTNAFNELDSRSSTFTTISYFFLSCYMFSQSFSQPRYTVVVSLAGPLEETSSESPSFAQTKGAMIQVEK